MKTEDARRAVAAAHTILGRPESFKATDIISPNGTDTWVITCHIGLRPSKVVVSVAGDIVRLTSARPVCPQPLFGLSERDFMLLRLLSIGMTTKALSERCGCSISTVKRVTRHLFDMTGSFSRVDLATWFTHHEHDLAAERWDLEDVRAIINDNGNHKGE